MNAKNIINTLVMLAMSGLVAWKGPGVASLIIGAVLAIGSLIAALHIIPPKAVEYIGDLEEALQKNAPEAAKEVVKDGPKASGAIAMLLVLIGISCCVVGNTTACNNQPLVHDVTNAFETISACVISSITTGSLSDPIQIAAQCGGIAIAQVIAIVEGEIARQKSDSGVGGSGDLVKLDAVLTKAKALK